MKIKNTFKNNGRRVVGLFMSVKPRTKIEKIFELPKGGVKYFGHVSLVNPCQGEIIIY
jgi:hypothetical protein